MGQVFEARAPDGTTVALKIIRGTSPERLYRFKREFRSLSAVVHPNIVALYDLVHVDEQGGPGLAFFTMELLRGAHFVTAIRDELADDAGLDEAGLRRLQDGLVGLACGLSCVHRHGLVHRDIKPSNVMITPTGRVVVLDLGLVRETRVASFDSLGENAPLLGTPLYMAPEQVIRSDDAGPAADWYAVGEVLWECLSGESRHAGRTLVEVFERKLMEPPEPPSRRRPGAPPHLDQLCVDLLAREPAARPSAGDVLTRLGRGDLVAIELTVQGLLGREHEARLLRDQLVQTGRAGAVFVSGPSGFGKTTLVEHVLERRPPRRQRGRVLGQLLRARVDPVQGPRLGDRRAEPLPPQHRRRRDRDRPPRRPRGAGPAVPDPAHGAGDPGDRRFAARRPRPDRDPPPRRRFAGRGADADRRAPAGGAGARRPAVGRPRQRAPARVGAAAQAPAAGHAARQPPRGHRGHAGPAGALVEELRGGRSHRPAPRAGRAAVGRAVGGPRGAPARRTGRRSGGRAGRSRGRRQPVLHRRAGPPRARPRQPRRRRPQPRQPAARAPAAAAAVGQAPGRGARGGRRPVAARPRGRHRRRRDRPGRSRHAGPPARRAPDPDRRRVAGRRARDLPRPRARGRGAGGRRIARVGAGGDPLGHRRGAAAHRYGRRRHSGAPLPRRQRRRAGHAIHPRGRARGGARVGLRSGRRAVPGRALDRGHRRRHGHAHARAPGLGAGQRRPPARRGARLHRRRARRRHAGQRGPAQRVAAPGDRALPVDRAPRRGQGGARGAAAAGRSVAAARHRGDDRRAARPAGAARHAQAGAAAARRPAPVGARRPAPRTSAGPPRAASFTATASPRRCSTPATCGSRWRAATRCGPRGRSATRPTCGR
ncbi:protein kinase domain-containing protein [Nannocystis pusilla]|uniref:protein kinase domain-containing protein n=1 Tax=Nannocystis pusilla TaxID=889268 RepID=UPI003DA5EE5E